jgi:hypothetical protein
MMNSSVPGWRLAVGLSPRSCTAWAGPERYTVLWMPAAEAALASLWANAPGRSDVTAAANPIDVVLQTDLETRGESRSGADRILVVPPLAITLGVKEPDRVVWVLGVRRLPPLRRDPDGSLVIAAGREVAGLWFEGLPVFLAPMDFAGDRLVPFVIGRDSIRATLHSQAESRDPDGRRPVAQPRGLGDS